MKRLEEIQNEYAIKCGFENWETLVVQTSLRTGRSIGKTTQIENYHKEIAQLYALEVAQASLNKAAKNANIKYHDGHNKLYKAVKHVQIGADNIQIDKESITNESNIILI
ncbi:hypothetical protein HZP54_18515 [Elizabethkingia anophelis]|nr:hypothetical protein [Elizabethkingia anophelis]MCT4256740.1 hypothetical protein [Elizabethkingia anophelis]